MLIVIKFLQSKDTMTLFVDFLLNTWKMLIFDIIWPEVKLIESLHFDIT